MTTATRTSQYTTTASGVAQVLYVAFELGVNEWKIGFTKDLETKPRVRAVPARDLKQLTREIAAAKEGFALPATAPVRSCYEAGRDGFWLHRHLVAEGIDNRVVDSASIEVTRCKRRAKSDGLDARTLLTMLLRSCAGEKKVWSVVRVPTVEEEDRRQLHRELRTLQQERTRAVNRMQGLLASQGLRFPKGRDVRTQLDAMRLWDGTPLPSGLRARLQRDWEHAEFLHAKILELERQRSHALKRDRSKAVDKVRQLLRLRAIGETGAWVYVNEFFGWRQFNNRKEVGAAAGFVPTPYQSGDGKQERGISKAGNRHVRAVAIQLAWAWLRYQPGSRLSKWFEERFSRGGPRARKVGIVALARQLLIDLWRFLRDGTVPEGALLKA
jgi:transposase